MGAHCLTSKTPGQGELMRLCGRLLMRKRGLGSARTLQRHELAADLGSQRHLNDTIMHIAAHLCLAAEHDPLAAENIAIDPAVQDHVGGADGPLDDAEFTHGERTVAGGAHTAGHATIHMQAARELDVSLDGGISADQRVDALTAAVTASEHGSSGEASPARAIKWDRPPR